MRNTLVRGAAAVTGTALALSLGLAAQSAQAAPIPAPTGADPAPAASAAAYLAAQPGPGNIIKTYWEFEGDSGSYDDYGVTIDAGYALDAAGGQGAKLTAVTDTLQANIGSYAFGGGSRAKLASFLLSQGRTGAAIDELVTALEGNISEDTDLVGRLVDPDPNDFNTPLTQSYAVSALHDAGSDEADEALAFLLEQQCTGGFFREYFSSKNATDQSCDGDATSTASVDTTGLAVLMLQDQRTDPAVATAITEALDWLTAQQAANGSLNSGNANSTGIAGWALGISGRTAAAAKAALWLRAHQLANAGSCAPYAAKHNGAVTVDDLGYTNAASGLDDVDNSVATRATTQALPALLWAPGGTAAGATTLTGPDGFVKAGTAQVVTVKGAPGNTLCVTRPGTTSRVVLDASGTATVPVTMPATTASVLVSTVDAGGEIDSRSIEGLAETTLKVELRKETVVRGTLVVVKVKGLAPGETVTVKLGKKSVEATAKANGKAKVEIKAVKVGKTKVKAIGEFKNRRGKASLTVLR